MPDSSPSPSEKRQSLRSFAEYFPFGPAPFVIFVLTILSGIYLLFHPVEDVQADLHMITFPPVHHKAYVASLPKFTEQTGKTVRIDLVHNTAVQSRLRSAFWADLDVPDLVEIEITWAGGFFRGPIEKVGFVDLRPYLEKTMIKVNGREVPLISQFPKSRLAPYTKDERIFGIPHDVHPVMLAYRADLVEPMLAGHGLTVEDLDTWEKFVAAGRKIGQNNPDPDAETEHYMLNLPRNDPSMLEILVFQRGGGYFNPDGELIMDSQIVLDTLLWYVPLASGRDRIAESPSMFGAPWVKSVSEGKCLFFFCPDWKSKSTEDQIPSMAGKMKLMPLPAWKPGGRRTSTWGGTMLGITKACQDKDAAWKLAQHLYTSKESIRFLFKKTNILPPFKWAWDLEVIQEKRPYWSNQRIGALYAELADDVPPQYSSPYVQMAKTQLGAVLTQCITFYEANQDAEDIEARLRAFARKALADEAGYVRKYMQRSAELD